MKNTILPGLVLLLITSTPAIAATRLVPDDYATIQAAIDACHDTDVVIVAPGTYTGEGNRDIDFRGRAITVRSENGPENCIIDCQNLGRGFHFPTAQDANSILDGFTITNGSAGSRAGGIYCGDSGPTILNCVIRNNNGGGIGCEKGNLTIRDCILSQNFGGSAILAACGSLTISNCIISDNRAQYGGGIHCYGYKCTSKVTITNCIITRNIAVHGGGIHLDSIRGDVELTNCTISNNDGGGIYCVHSWHPMVTNCTVVDNWSRYGGGIYFSYTTTPTVTNCTLAGNSASNGSAVCCDVSGPRITNSILWSNGTLRSPVICLPGFPK